MNHQNPYESPKRVSGSRPNGSVRSHLGVRVCGVLNIIAGCAGGCLGLVFTLLTIGFGGGIDRGVIVTLPLLLAGVLSAVSGVCLLFSPQRTRSVAIGLLALAVVLSLTFSVFFVLEFHLDGEETLMFIGLPGLVTLLAIAELFYLWRWRSAK